MEDNICGIYSITNSNTGKKYIGSSKNIQKRIKEHFADLRSGVHHATPLQNSFNKHGEDVFTHQLIEKIEDPTDKEFILEREQFWINYYQSFISANGYNLSKFSTHSENELIPVVKLDYITGKYICAYDSISDANIDMGKHKYNDNISACVRGEQKSAWNFKWLKAVEGKSISDYENEAQNIIIKRFPVEQIDLKTGEVLNLFPSAPEAEIYLGREPNNGGVYSCCNGKQKHSAGYKWRWFKPLNLREKQFHCGIDVGKSGAVVLISNDLTEVYTFPIPKIGDEVDIHRLSKYFENWQGYVRHTVIELVHSIFGVSAKANFTFGKVFGIQQTILCSFNFSHTFINPKLWQKEVFTGIPVVRKPSKPGKDGKMKEGSVETKIMAVAAVQKLFPNVELTKTKRSIKPDLGIVDALLMAEYSRRKFN